MKKNNYLPAVLCTLCTVACCLLYTSRVAHGGHRDTLAMLVVRDAEGVPANHHIVTGAKALRDIPVSYTHLDVYKRQAQLCALASASSSAP